MIAPLALWAALALLAAAPPAAAARSAPATSALWGKSGEKWKPGGPFMDFSYAGYWNSEAPIPRPPVTKRLKDFQERGRSDSTAIQAMVDWANRQSQKQGWIVLSLPAGSLELSSPIRLTRPQTVLRGAGKGRTRLAISNPLSREGGCGGSCSSGGGWILAAGLFKNGAELARVTGSAERGSYEIEVSSASRLKEGQMVTVMYDGSHSQLARAIMDDELRPGELFESQEIYYTTQIKKIDGETVTLQRALPLEIKGAYDVSLVQRDSSLYQVGVEDLSIEFKWERYAGHHKERGWNGVEMEKVRDGWVRNVEVANADNGVLVTSCSAVTVEGVEVTVTKERPGPPDAAGERWDGHWGVRVGLSTDVLVRNFDIKARMHHSVGADSHALFCAFEGGRAPGGNLELHRAQVGQILFTDIDVESSGRSFYSGGPDGSGPATGAWTTYWNIRSKSGEHSLPEQANGSPGSCSYGPKLNFIGVTFKRESRLCDEWIYEPGSVQPPNLFEAQLRRRKGGGSGGSGGSGGKGKGEEGDGEGDQADGAGQQEESGGGKGGDGGKGDGSQGEGEHPQSPPPKSPAPKSPAPKSPAPKSPAPESPAPESPTPESPAPEEPTPDSPAPEDPDQPLNGTDAAGSAAQAASLRKKRRAAAPPAAAAADDKKARAPLAKAATAATPSATSKKPAAEGAAAAKPKPKAQAAVQPRAAAATPEAAAKKPATKRPKGQAAAALAAATAAKRPHAAASPAAAPSRPAASKPKAGKPATAATQHAAKPSNGTASDGAADASDAASAGAVAAPAPAPALAASAAAHAANATVAAAPPPPKARKAKAPRRLKPSTVVTAASADPDSAVPDSLAR